MASKGERATNDTKPKPKTCDNLLKDGFRILGDYSTFCEVQQRGEIPRFKRGDGEEAVLVGILKLWGRCRAGLGGRQDGTKMEMVM